MAIREGKWDCKSCGAKGNRGPTLQCENCASPRPKDVEFYLDDEEGTTNRIVTDEKELKKAQEGPNWVCSSCGSHNELSFVECESCGNPKDFETDRDVKLKQSVNYFDKFKKKQSPTHDAPPESKPSPFWTFVKWLAIAIIFFFILTIPEKSIDVVVKSHVWSRSIVFEENKFVQESDWSLPAGAINVTQASEVHHYNQVQTGTQRKTRTVQVKTGSRRVKCGTKNLGNGYFEDVYCDEPIYSSQQESYDEPIYRQDPVYQTKYYYTIKKWVPTEPVKLSGEGINPVWPVYKGEHENREKKRDEIYVLKVEDPSKKTHQEKMDLKKWSSIKDGAILKAKKSLIFGTYYGLKD